MAACGRALDQRGDATWRAKVDGFLSGISWDKTWADMDSLMVAGLRAGTGAGAGAARAKRRLQHV